MPMTTAVAPRSSSSCTSAGPTPGSWRVPVSFQSHSRAPPGKIFASLKKVSSVSSRPHEMPATRGEMMPSSATFAPRGFVDGGHVLLAVTGLYRLGVGEHGQQEIGVLGGRCGGVGDFGAVTGQRLGLLRRAVPDAHVYSRVQQVS